MVGDNLRVFGSARLQGTNLLALEVALRDEKGEEVLGPIIDEQKTERKLTSQSVLMVVALMGKRR